MKKMLATVLAAVMLFSITACGANVDAMEVYEKVLANTKEASSMDMKMDMKMKMTMGEETQDINALVTMQMLTKDPADANSLQMALNMDMKMPDLPEGSAKVEMYVKDGMVYMTEPTMNMKMKMPLEASGIAIDDLNMSKNLLVDKDTVESAKATKVGDGYELTFELKESAISDLLNGMMGQATAETDESLTYDIKKLEYVLLVDKDYQIKSLKADMDFEMTANGEHAVVQATVVADPFAINTLESITFPSDLDSYTGI